MNEDLNALEIRIKNIKEELYAAECKLNEIKAQPLSSKYPKELVELGTWEAESDDHIFLHYAYKTFAQLVETCREWNRIDGFVPDWGNESQKKNVIVCDQVNLNIFSVSFSSCPLYFSTRETARLFLDTFYVQIQNVKELI